MVCLKGKHRQLVVGALLALCGLFLMLPFGFVFAGEPAQIPTGSIPTVTGTPVGAIALVLDNEQGFVNVRGGPSTVAYDIIGVLVEGSNVPALGRSPGGDWVQIAYPGVPGGIAWVYSDLVDVRGSLPVIEPPPTSTPAVTSTIDPTLAAQFLVEVPPTRLATFTEPAPLLSAHLSGGCSHCLAGQGSHGTGDHWSGDYRYIWNAAFISPR